MIAVTKATTHLNKLASSNNKMICYMLYICIVYVEKYLMSLSLPVVVSCTFHVRTYVGDQGVQDIACACQSCKHNTVHPWEIARTTRIQVYCMLPNDT